MFKKMKEKILDSLQEAAGKATEAFIKDLRLDVKGSVDIAISSVNGIEVSLFDKSRNKKISANRISPNSVVSIPLDLEVDFNKNK